MICMYMKIRAYPTFYNLIKTNSDCVVAMHIIVNLIHLGSFAILIGEFHKKKVLDQDGTSIYCKNKFLQFRAG